MRLLVFLGILLVAACGKVSDPLPPFVRIPEAAADFSAEQVGYELRFRWTNPSRNLDQSVVTDLDRAQIRAGDEVIADLETTGAAQVQTFVLPARNLTGVVREYSVSFSTEEGRLSDSSPGVRISILEVPGSGSIPEALVDQGAVGISWMPPVEDRQLANGYRVYRSGQLLTPEPLEALAFEDRAFVEGEVYQYVVVPVLRIGGGWIEGVSYPALEVEALDRTPPAAPGNLEILAIAAGGAFVQWEQSPETDVARYRVYRRRSEGGELVAIDDGEWTPTAYADSEYEPGFEYAVSAVDRFGNESPISAVVSGQ